MTRHFTDADIRLYLLGGLPEQDCDALEDAYFGDPALLARVDEAQHDLADDYAAGRLAPDDRARFEERHLASTDGREEVALAQVLRLRQGYGGQVLGQGSGGQVLGEGRARRSLPSWLLLAAAAVLIVGAAYFATRRGPAGTPTPTEPPAIATTPTPPATPPTVEPPLLRVATLVLTTDLSRGNGQPPTLAPPADLTHVDLVVPAQDIRDASPSARVTTVEGRAIWSGSIERDAGQPPRARVPAAALPPGDYMLSLGDVASGATTYFFRVRR